MNWSEKDLDLFKSRQQRGTAPPSAKEFELQCVIGDMLKRWCSREWRYTHIPLGEYRTKATAGRLKRMGVMPGWPDYIFAHKLGRVCFLELKRYGHKASEEQDELAVFLMAAGHKYLVTSSFDNALNFLREQGIVPSTITTNKDTGGAASCDSEETRIE